MQNTDHVTTPGTPENPIFTRSAITFSKRINLSFAFLSILAPVFIAKDFSYLTTTFIPTACGALFSFACSSLAIQLSEKALPSSASAAQQQPLLPVAVTDGSITNSQQSSSKCVPATGIFLPNIFCGTLALSLGSQAPYLYVYGAMHFVPTACLIVSGFSELLAHQSAGRKEKLGGSIFCRMMYGHSFAALCGFFVAHDDLTPVAIFWGFHVGFAMLLQVCLFGANPNSESVGNRFLFTTALSAAVGTGGLLASAFVPSLSAALWKWGTATLGGIALQLLLIGINQHVCDRPAKPTDCDARPGDPLIPVAPQLRWF